MVPILLTASVLAAMFGVACLSEGTTGIGFVALACFIAIVARVVQASEQRERATDAVDTTGPRAVRPARDETRAGRRQLDQRVA